MKLSPRLKLLADFAAEGKRIADVGTDHGYLPVWLALYGRTESIAATDIRIGPLQSAICKAREAGVLDRIRFVLCDGLCCDGAQDTDTVIIAGMGGETIAAILKRAVWTTSGVRLILQLRQKRRAVRMAGKIGYKLSGAVLVEDAHVLSRSFIRTEASCATVYARIF
jgi:tRNA (adenine22-N1)-methyltransferase